jgi:uncharacterized membrane protein
MPLPLHPMLVHFPIAFYVLELWLLLLWHWKSDPTFHRFASIAFKLGYLLMLSSLLSGIIDHGGFKPFEGLVAVHFYWALGAAVVYTARALCWRFCRTDDRFYRLFQIGGAVAGNIVMAATAFAGGRLVYP